MIYAERNKGIVKTLDVNFQPIADAALLDAEQEGMEILLTHGTRTFAEQKALHYAFINGIGALAAPAGYSKHNYGVAFDCVPVRKDGSVDYSDTVTYNRFARICKAKGMVWGGDWKGKFHDMPHFEYTQGLSIEDFRAGKRIQPIRAKINPVANWTPKAQIKRLTRGIARATGYVKGMLERQLERLRRRI